MVFHENDISMQELLMKTGYRPSLFHPTHSRPPMERKHSSLYVTKKKNREKQQEIIVPCTEREMHIMFQFVMIACMFVVQFHIQLSCNIPEMVGLSKVYQK